ncbi:MAG: multicopper oxidase domain-containing protein, partial [Thermomicrobiales bacterium]|nr:multicopper oxidase domain-containing protein [Thermomicrobiales bacterium]
MSQSNVPTNAPSTPARDDDAALPSPSKFVSRRTLLKTAAGAVGLNLVADTSIAEARQTPAASPVPIETPISLSATSVETWGEPWIWRPSDWPGQALELNVVENENPGAIVGYGNPSAILFSYGGMTPGPTIRMRGDETLFVRLRNLLGQNYGTTTVGPYPDPKALPSWMKPSQVTERAREVGLIRSDFCIGEHVNGVHSLRVTNLHTHGLHVRPGKNSDGTHSDNIILRLIDEADLEEREANRDSPYCAWLQDPNQTTYLQEDEVTGFADYEFRLGNVQSKLTERLGLPPQAHPPGTHWYHPHCHGATHNQVASGMAGFLIIEGDVDEAINLALTGERFPDPQLRAGAYDYMERVMFIQRVFNLSVDPDAPTQELKQGGNAVPLVNGDQRPDTITMRPGAIERWRVLNGSVDGQGYMRFMVVKGQYAVDESSQAGNESIQLMKSTDPVNQAFAPVTSDELEADKQTLYQLAFDGVTLVAGEGENARYTIKDLSQQNPGTENPIDQPLSGKPNQAMLANIQAAYADASSITNTYVRPNEVYLAPANRTDLFFQAPALSPGSEADYYTILGRASVVQSDNYQSALQSNYNKPNLVPQPEDVVVGYVVVSNGANTEDQSATPIPAFDVMSL